MISSFFYKHSVKKIKKLYTFLKRKAMDFEAHVLEKLKENNEMLKKIETQTTLTNGRVTKLETRVDIGDKIFYSAAVIMLTIAWYFIQKKF